MSVPGELYARRFKLLIVVPVTWVREPLFRFRVKSGVWLNVDYGKQLAALTPDDQMRFYKAKAEVSYQLNNQLERAEPHLRLVLS